MRRARGLRRRCRGGRVLGHPPERSRPPRVRRARGGGLVDLVDDGSDAAKTLRIAHGASVTASFATPGTVSSYHLSGRVSFRLAGLKVAEGSSEYFVVTAVLFEDLDEATSCDKQVDVLREQLGWPSGTEFHFNRCRRSVRERFLLHVVPFQFFYLSVVIDKRKLSGPGFAFPNSFYKYAVNLVFQNAKPYLDEATVVIDGSGDRRFKRQLQTYLKARINDDKVARRIKQVKIQQSHTNNLIQLADMVCGAVARSFRRDKKDHDLYRKIIRHRELRVQVWPT